MGKGDREVALGMRRSAASVAGQRPSEPVPDRLLPALRLLVCGCSEAEVTYVAGDLGDPEQHLVGELVVARRLKRNQCLAVQAVGIGKVALAVAGDGEQVVREPHPLRIAGFLAERSRRLGKILRLSVLVAAVSERT